MFSSCCTNHTTQYHAYQKHIFKDEMKCHMKCSSHVNRTPCSLVWIPEKQDFSSLSRFLLPVFSAKRTSLRPLCALSLRVDFEHCLISSFKEYHGVEWDMENMEKCSNTHFLSHRFLHIDHVSMPLCCAGPLAKKTEAYLSRKPWPHLCECVNPLA